MTPREFAVQLSRILSPRKGQDLELTLEQATQAALKVPVENRNALLDACLDVYSTMPTRADILKVAEERDLRNSGGTSPSGYNQSLGGYIAWKCRICHGVYSMETSGSRCPYCEVFRTEQILVSEKQFNFSEEVAQARQNAELIRATRAQGRAS